MPHTYAPLPRETYRYSANGHYQITQPMPARSALRRMARTLAEGVVIASIMLVAMYGLIGLVAS